MTARGPILVATDFSPAADLALDRAIALAREHQAEVVLAYGEAFVDRSPIGDEGAVMSELGALAESLRADERRELEARLARVGAAGVTGRVLAREGAPGELVPALAAELGAWLVVIGTHGRTGITRFLLGSVAELVVRRTACDVLVVRASAAPASGAFRELVVATDFSAPAEAALRAAVALAVPGARVRLVHSWQYPVGAWGLNLLGEHSRAASTVREAITSTAQANLDRLVAAHQKDGVTVEGLLVEGPAASAVTDLAEREQVDLIAIATHGHRGVERWLLGSVAEATVRHAPCSVLVVHAH
ncbi:MAG: universal stress protein [Kofleriaceae bacterium]|nr:universal stress protein [Kofleriaceae bacterium]MBP9202892.1 universal stress protein [Kofleriaceae bacterium]